MSAGSPQKSATSRRPGTDPPAFRRSDHEPVPAYRARPAPVARVPQGARRARDLLGTRAERRPAAEPLRHPGPRRRGRPLAVHARATAPPVAGGAKCDPTRSAGREPGVVTTSQEPARLAVHDGDGREWRSKLGELVFAGLMFLPGLVALGVMLWVIVAVVLR